ncbi:MAG: M1 family peptidase [Flavobacteriaceae bacterium]|jgi:aminopeptidase N|nr:M1 family peptidase [Flavobacteriaceae bacterium]
MKNSILVFFLSFFLISNIGKAQDESGYRPSATIINDLVHTKLKVSFDIPNEKLFGEAWITLTPHFYPTDSLTLDAKAMEISAVNVNGKVVKPDYNSKKLKIKLDRTYKNGEEYTVYVKYTAVPADVKQAGSVAIGDAKGLYFINPKGEDPDKPTEIWTQGETESNSVWFPTIDKPNQKSTEEIYITVPDKFVTLSNGLLKSQTKNPDGTRTDYWNMDKKHAPYLFFMGIGDFAVVKDHWKDISVDYYVNKEYEPYAKAIFGDTPEMIQFYSDILKYPYPWQKYSQMVAHDFVSGAMENTTATLHSEDNVQQKPGQLIDENQWEAIIAHELFHHWFGDLVTTESWANLTVNESFANYSEYLWFEHKYGKDRAEEHKYESLQTYLRQGDNFEKDLVRFHHADKEDMFDPVTYNKGGIILHMLRKYLGDEAFFAGLNKYLTENQYKSAEAHNLRLALEEVSGRDLNWFFNEWYFSNGQPKIKIGYTYDNARKVVKVDVIQTQNPYFQFPIDIDIYENGKAVRTQVWAKAQANNSFELPYKAKPQLVNVNPDDVLLSEIVDDKTTEQYIFQYKNAPEYHSRRTAIEKLADVQTSNAAALETLLQAASSDKFEGLRKLAVSLLDEKNPTVQKKSAVILEKIASSDPKTLVQADAIIQLAKIDAKKYADLFKNLSKNESYAIKAACINALLPIDTEATVAIANKISDKKVSGSLGLALANVAVTTQDVSKLGWIADNFINMLFSAQSQEEAEKTISTLQTIMSGDYPQETKTIVDSFVKIYPQVKQYGGNNTLQVLQNLLQGSLDMKQQAYNASPNQSLKNQVQYISDGISKLK